MELSPNADESAIINDTPERVDSWNEPRSIDQLRAFVLEKTVHFGDELEDDLF